MVLYNNIIKKSRGFGNVSKKIQKNIFIVYFRGLLSIKMHSAAPPRAAKLL